MVLLCVNLPGRYKGINFVKEHWLDMICQCNDHDDSNVHVHVIVKHGNVNSNPHEFT